MRSPGDASVVEREPRLPGLGILLDDEAFARALQAAVPSVHLGRVEARYVRYKPATSVLVAYRIDVDGAGLDVHACAYADEAAHRLDDAARAHWAPTPLGTGGVALSDAVAFVWAFPNDRRLRPLRRLGVPERRSEVLDRILSPELRDAEVVTLSYKPQRRYVGKASAPGAAPAVIRLYAPEDFEVAAHNARAFASTDTLRVPQRCRRSRRHKSIAMEWIEGERLDRVLATDDAEAACHAAGAALAALHEQAPPLLRTWDAARLVRTLTAAADAVITVLPALEPRVRALAAALAARIGSTGEPSCPVHGDFGPEQVVIGDGPAAIIDLDRCGWGHPGLDLGSFRARLAGLIRGGVIDGEHAARAEAALRRGYAGVRGAPPAADPFTATALLRTAVEPFRSRAARWPELVEAALVEAEQALHAEAVVR